MAMVLPRNNDEVGPSAYYEAFAAITADVSLIRADKPCRAILVGGNGTLVVTRPDGTNVTFPDLTGPAVLDIQAIAIVDLGTSASNLVVYW